MIDTIVGLNFIVFLFFLSKEIGWKLGLLSSILISWLLFLILRLLNYTWKPIVTILVLVLVVSIIKAIFKMIKNNNNKSQPTNNNKKYNENNKQNILGTKEKHINNQRLDFGTEGKLNKQVQDFLEKKEKQKNTRKWNDINLKENKNSNTINMKNTIKKELKKVETIATSKAVLPWIEKFIIRTTKDFDNEDIPTEDYMKKLDDLIKFLRYKDFVKSDDVLDIMYLNLIIEKMKNSIYLNYMKINLKIKEDEGKNQIISKYISCHGNKSYKINNLKILTQILKQDIENTKKEVHSYNEKMKEQYENEKREKELFEDDRSYTIDYIDKLDGYEFEDYLATLFEKFGYEIQRTTYSGDYGADLVISDGAKKIIIQAKNYSGNVGNEAVQQVVAAKLHYNGDRAVIITNSYYTKNAKELAKTTGVILIDRDALIKVLKNGRIYFNDLCT